MYRSPFHDPAPATFIDQFEWDGGDWLYRYKETGPAYRVTNVEKDGFVAAFNRRQLWFTWIVLGALFFLVGALIEVPAFGAIADAMPKFGFAWGMLLGAALRFAIDLFAFRAPMRALEQRVPVAAAWPKTARVQLALDRKSPTELIGTSFAAAGFLFLLGVLDWPLDSNGLLLMIGFTWMALRAIAQAVRERQVARLVHPDHAANNLI